MHRRVPRNRPTHPHPRSIFRDFQTRTDFGERLPVEKPQHHRIAILIAEFTDRLIQGGTKFLPVCGITAGTAVRHIVHRVYGCFPLAAPLLSADHVDG